MSREFWASAERPLIRLPLCGHVQTAPTHAQQGLPCSVCADRIPSQFGHGREDYVPAPDLTWDGAYCTSTRHIQRPDLSECDGAINDIDDLVAALSSPCTQQVKFDGCTRSIRSEVQAPGRGFLVWRACTAGCTVHSGVVELPERAVLLLSGHGVHFQDVTFRGGIVMCAGPQYSGTFRNCTFLFSAVYAVHGAAITLRGCRILDGQPGITVSGGATVATLSECTFQSCLTSIVAERGAAVAADRCRMERTFAAVVSNDQGTHVSMRQCMVRTSHGGPYGGTGVAARGGSLRLELCSLKGFTTACVGMNETTSIEAHDVRFSGSPQGVALAAHARGLLRECRLLCSDTGLGVPMPMAVFLGRVEGHGGGARMQLERCTVRRGTVRAIDVQDGSAVAARLCAFDCTMEVLASGEHGGRAALSRCSGVSAAQCLRVESPAGELRLQGGAYAGAATAVAVVRGARLAASGCELSSRGLPDVAGVLKLRAGASARLSRCHLHTGAAGVDAIDSSVHASDLSVRDILSEVPAGPGPHRRAEHSVSCHWGLGFLCSGGQTFVCGGSVERCIVGVGAEGRDASVRVEGVLFKDCVRGMEVEDGAEVTAADCEFWGLKREQDGESPSTQYTGSLSGPSAGVMFTDAGRGDLQRCVFEGHPIDIVAGSADGLVIQHCEFKSCAARQACVMARGDVVLEDCVMTGGAEGVQARRGASCTLRRCRLTGLCCAGVTAEAGSSVKVLDHTSVQGAHKGLVAEENAELAVQDTRISDVTLGIVISSAGGCVVTAKRVTVAASGIGVCADCRYGQPVSIKLVDSVITGGDVGVCAADSGGTLAVTRCKVSDCGVGVLFAGNVRGRVRETEVTRCERGVMVGDSNNDVTDACRECGLRGKAALEAAYQVLLATGGDTARAGRCTHDGWVSVVTLARVQVTNCSVIAVLTSPHGRVEASGVMARDCRTGFCVQAMGTHRSSAFSDCRAVRCGDAVRARWHLSSVDDECLLAKQLPGITVSLVD